MGNSVLSAFQCFGPCPRSICSVQRDIIFSVLAEKTGADDNLSAAQGEGSSGIQEEVGSISVHMHFGTGIPKILQGALRL